MLGETVREVRRQKGRSIEQLSKRSRVPLQIITEIESSNASYVPSDGNTVLLGETLMVPVGLLLGEREQLFERWRLQWRHRSGE